MKLLLSFCAMTLMLTACDGSSVHVPGGTRVQFPDGTSVQTGGRYYEPHHGNQKCPPGHHMKGWC